jgi:hypothetical protein
MGDALSLFQIVCAFADFDSSTAHVFGVSSRAREVENEVSVASVQNDATGLRAPLFRFSS